MKSLDIVYCEEHEETGNGKKKWPPGDAGKEILRLVDIDRYIQCPECKKECFHSGLSVKEFLVNKGRHEHE